MKKVTLGSRIILGLIFFVFGLNGFFNFIPMPEEMPENMQTFMSGLMVTKYFFPLLKGTEVVCGLLLLINRWTSLALVILAPIVLNIFLVHLFMAPDGLPMAIAIGILTTYLSFFADPYSKKIKQLFC